MDALRCPPGDTPIEVISGGEKRRVALCRLLLPPVDCLFPAPFTLIFTFTPRLSASRMVSGPIPLPLRTASLRPVCLVAITTSSRRPATAAPSTRSLCPAP